MNPRIDKLASFYNNRQNVLLIGKHGVGKTAMIKKVFEDAGLVLGESYLYFSASTLDPWTDLIGVPKEIIDEDGDRVLDFVRPKALSKNSKIEAIFFDEYNRAPKKIRNAIMELIQFKSINGKKFPNLKVVWAAINPETEEEIYDVEKLDPAQKDRFEIPMPIPYECDSTYFCEKYGEDMGLAAIEWWNDLPVEMKDSVSPRRVDYALNLFRIGGNMEDVLPGNTNVAKLHNLIINGPIHKALHKFMKENDVKKAKTFISNENNYEQSKKYIKSESEICKFYLPLINNEKICLMMSESNGKLVKETVFSYIKQSKTGIDPCPDITKKYNEMLHNIISASADKNLISEISSVYDKIKTKDLTDVKSSSVFDWSDVVSEDLKNDKDASYNKLAEMYATYEDEGYISEENAEQILAFIHMYINTLFSIRITKMNSKLFMGLYNNCMRRIVGDRSKYISDEVFKTKIKKMTVVMKSDGILESMYC